MRELKFSSPQVEKIYFTVDLIHEETDLRLCKQTASGPVYFRRLGARGRLTENPADLRLSNHTMRPTALEHYKIPKLDIVDESLWEYSARSIVDIVHEAYKPEKISAELRHLSRVTSSRPTPNGSRTGRGGRIGRSRLTYSPP